MANSLCFSPLISLNSVEKPGLISHKYTSRKANWITDATFSSKNAAFEALVVSVFGIFMNIPWLVECLNQATDNKLPSTKPNSLLCADCDGNGAKQCGQCKGTGVNSEDHYGGRFKAGASCWLCRGKKEILCGNCNGAGFIGGFMSTFDD